MTNGTTTYLKAIATVRGKLADFLTEEEIRRLQANLDKLRETFTDDSDFVDETLDFLETHFPDIYREIQIGGYGSVERMELLPGEPGYLPPGTLLLCPQCSYEHELRTIGEWPVYCPRDGSQLKPKA